MPIDRALRHACREGDFLQTGAANAAFEENPTGGLDDLAAGDFSVFFCPTNHLAFFRVGNELRGYLHTSAFV